MRKSSAKLSSAKFDLPRNISQAWDDQFFKLCDVFPFKLSAFIGAMKPNDYCCRPGHHAVERTFAKNQGLKSTVPCDRRL